MRQLQKIIAGADKPPFTVQRNGTRVEKASAGEVLDYIFEDAKKEYNVTRFKGLGEMNAEDLWSTTMNAETRTLLKVRLEDAVEAERIFTTLMGEDVESRRKFIEENALDVVNLDI
jgi:DNA gyrase subunit B